jgi:small subunit ribosomal protein S1
MKQLQGDPWQGAEAKFAVGAQFKGCVTFVSDYGPFVELEPGIEGLLYVSERPSPQKRADPREIWSVSQEVTV